MPYEPESDWDCYICTVDGLLALIVVDLEAIQHAPVAGKPWLLWVRAQLLSPLETGLSSPEEAPQLHAIEHTLDASLSELTDAEPIGRSTVGQRREWFFYASGHSALERAVAQVRERFPEYTLEHGTLHDPQWRHYRELLYPCPQDLRLIHTRRVICQLEEHGDVHAIPRPVDHALRFRSAKDRRRFAALAGHAGFKVRLENNTGSRERPYFVNVVREDPVELAHIKKVVDQLVQWAEGFDGDYEGWGSPICSGETPKH